MGSKFLWGLIAALTVAVGVLTWQWLSERDDRVAAQAAAEEATKMLLAQSAALNNLHLSMARLDSTMNEMKIRLQASIDSLQRERQRVAQSTGQAVATLREQLSEEQRVLLDSVTKGYDTQIDLLESEVVHTGRLLALAEERADRQEDLLEQERAWRQTALDKMAEVREAKKESLLSKAAKGAVVVLAVMSLTN